MNLPGPIAALSDRGKGILMSLVGVFVLSPDSLLIRLASLDDYTLIFYRGLLPVFSISLVLWLYYRRDFIPALLRIGDRIAMLLVERARSDAATEGLNSFIEKRPPSWRPAA